MIKPTKTTTEAVERYKKKWLLVSSIIAECSLVYDRKNKRVHIDWNNQYLKYNIEQERGYRAAMVDMGLIDLRQSKELEKWFRNVFTIKTQVLQRGEELLLRGNNL
ncbi:hypothetical protein KC887_00775 [Candidatus Kaiserbacteria bacterium]|nr:hypothetical protein [Candidatus Kaiserbacteria bacterium]